MSHQDRPSDDVASDAEFLMWVADRFVYVKGESASVDFVLRLRRMAAAAGSAAPAARAVASTVTKVTAEVRAAVCSPHGGVVPGDDEEAEVRRCSVSGCPTWTMCRASRPIAPPPPVEVTPEARVPPVAEVCVVCGCAILLSGRCEAGHEQPKGTR
jgi:hypothetical protein